MINDPVLLVTFLLLLFLSLFFLFRGTKLLFGKKNETDQQTDYPAAELELVKFVLFDFIWYKSMSDQERLIFAERIIKFMFKKNFIARQGFSLEAKHKIIISALACRITSGLHLYRYNAMHTILIYPQQFTNKVSGKTTTGESDRNGVVALSWKHTEETMYSQGESVNTAINTFAKALRDNEMGKGTNEAYFSNYLRKFERVISVFHGKIKNEPHSFFNDCDVTTPEALYATIIERFFSTPVELNRNFPELYYHLGILLNLNPASYTVSTFPPRKTFLDGKTDPGKTLLRFGNIELSQPLFPFMKPFFTGKTFAITENGILIRHGMYSKTLEFIPFGQVTTIWYQEEISSGDDDEGNIVLFGNPTYKESDNLICSVDVAYITTTHSEVISYSTLNMKKEVIDQLIQYASGHYITVQLHTLHPSWGMHSVHNK